jgi:hypothetical protein
MAGQTLSAINFPINAVFQWLDCNNNFSTLLGETNQIFTPITNGSYAVLIDNVNCQDTSACYDFVTVGEMNVSDENSFIIVLNPVVDNLFIKASSNLQITKIKIIDQVGKEIYLGPDDGKGINLSHVESGCYIIEIFCNNAYFIQPIIKI